MQLRDYQQEGADGVYDLWSKGLQNVCLVEPTGGGKTVILAHIAHRHKGATCMIAHRQELVIQISVAMASEGVYHNIIGSRDTFNNCMKAHYRKFGKDFLDTHSNVAVAGVDTLNIRMGKDPHLRAWAKTVSLLIQDESHHVLKSNKWGSATGHFTNPDLVGLYVTATPLRADGQGLSRETDGLMDGMIVGPSMRELIDRGYLTDYRIFAPPSDLDMTQVKLSKDGDYSQKGTVKAVQKSHILGDVVEHYKKLAMGKLGVTFVPSVDIANQTAEAFRKAGIPALAVSGKSSDKERSDALRKFERREILQLVNVDLFGEGYDLPALEVISLARPTMSYSLFVQQFGRVLRLMEGKEVAIIIDHVGNVLRHGLPDAPRVWSLDRRDKKAKVINDVIPTTVCPECTAVYERTHNACPYCGYAPEPLSRSSIEFVDGDLCELTAEALAVMRGDADKAIQPPDEFMAKMIAKGGKAEWAMHHVKKHKERISAQMDLRASIAQWGGYQVALGRGISEAQKRFYYKFGIDVLGAQALKTKEANELKDRIISDYT